MSVLNKARAILSPALPASSWRVALAACAFTAVSCGSDERPATQVVVLVGGDPSIERLHVLVQTEHGVNVSDDRSIELGSAGLPTSFTIVPAASPAKRFKLVLLGHGGPRDELLVSYGLIAKFSEGKTTLLPVTLATECIDRLCTCTGEACGTTCDPATAFTNSDSCPKPILYENLLEVEPGEELTTLDEGPGNCMPGEQYAANGVTRIDLDECAFELDDCEAPSVCRNVAGGKERFRCESRFLNVVDVESR